MTRPTATTRVLRSLPLSLSLARGPTSGACSPLCCPRRSRSGRRRSPALCPIGRPEREAAAATAPPSPLRVSASSPPRSEKKKKKNKERASTRLISLPSTATPRPRRSPTPRSPRRTAPSPRTARTRGGRCSPPGFRPRSSGPGSLPRPWPRWRRPYSLAGTERLCGGRKKKENEREILWCCFFFCKKRKKRNRKNSRGLSLSLSLSLSLFSLALLQDQPAAPGEEHVLQPQRQETADKVGDRREGGLFFIYFEFVGFERESFFAVRIVFFFLP